MSDDTKRAARAPVMAERAAQITKAILADLTDRRGFRQEWDGCDADIQAEIASTWERIVRDELGRTFAGSTTQEKTMSDDKTTELRWEVGQVWERDEHRWRVDIVHGDFAVLQSLTTSWARTGGIRIEDHLRDGWKCLPPSETLDEQLRQAARRLHQGVFAGTLFNPEGLPPSIPAVPAYGPFGEEQDAFTTDSVIVAPAPAVKVPQCVSGCTSKPDAPECDVCFAERVRDGRVFRAARVFVVNGLETTDEKPPPLPGLVDITADAQRACIETLRKQLVTAEKDRDAAHNLSRTLNDNWGDAVRACTETQLRLDDMTYNHGCMVAERDFARTERDAQQTKLWTILGRLGLPKEASAADAVWVISEKMERDKESIRGSERYALRDHEERKALKEENEKLKDALMNARLAEAQHEAVAGESAETMDAGMDALLSENERLKQELRVAENDREDAKHALWAAHEALGIRKGSTTSDTIARITALDRQQAALQQQLEAVNERLCIPKNSTWSAQLNAVIQLHEKYEDVARKLRDRPAAYVGETRRERDKAVRQLDNVRAALGVPEGSLLPEAVRDIRAELVARRADVERLTRELDEVMATIKELRAQATEVAYSSKRELIDRVAELSSDLDATRSHLSKAIDAHIYAAADRDVALARADNAERERDNLRFFWTRIVNALDQDGPVGVVPASRLAVVTDHAVATAERLKRELDEALALLKTARLTGFYLTGFIDAREPQLTLQRELNESRAVQTTLRSLLETINAQLSLPANAPWETTLSALKAERSSADTRLDDAVRRTHIVAHQCHLRREERLIEDCAKIAQEEAREGERRVVIGEHEYCQSVADEGRAMSTSARSIERKIRALAETKR